MPLMTCPACKCSPQRDRHPAIQPIELRLALVDDFVHSIKPSIKLELSALQVRSEGR